MARVPRVLSSAPRGLPCCPHLYLLCRVLTWGIWVACKQCSLSRCNRLCKTMTCSSLVLNHRTKHMVPCAALRWVNDAYLALTPQDKSKIQVFSNCGQLTMSACTQECHSEQCHNEQKHERCCSQRWYDGVAMSEPVNARWVRDALVSQAISEQQPALWSSSNCLLVSQLWNWS